MTVLEFATAETRLLSRFMLWAHAKHPEMQVSTIEWEQWFLDWKKQGCPTKD
jgi:hypothetical protein